MNTALLGEIRASLTRLSAAAPGLSTASKTDKLYELFVLCCVVQALSKIGANMEARDSRDNRTSTLTSG